MRPSVFWVFWALVFLSMAACKGGPAGSGATPPAPGPAVFLSEAVGLCRESCAPRDALWSASEVAGAMHLRCSCPPLSTLQPGPKVKRNRPKVSSTSAKARGVEGPAGASSHSVHEELGAVAVEDSGRTGLSFDGGTP